LSIPPCGVARVARATVMQQAGRAEPVSASGRRGLHQFGYGAVAADLADRTPMRSSRIDLFIHSLHTSISDMLSA
jgi:hypothetical protein